jgi:hypothetical protein
LLPTRSWTLFVFRISWNFVRDISTVFEEIKHIGSLRRIACTEFFSWFQCTQTVFKINTIIYRNIIYLLMNFIIWNESWNVQRLWQSCTRTIFYQIIKINKTQILLKYFFGDRGVKFLEKRRENVQIFQALRWRFDIWEAIFAVKNVGMSARNSYIQM